MSSQSRTAEVVRWEPTGITEVDMAVARWRPSSMVPLQFKDRDGNVKLADLGLAALILWDLEVSPRINLPFVYVIKGRVGLMATLQRALAARAGWDLEEIETSPTACAWRIRPAGCTCPTDSCRHWKPPYRVTMAMAERAGWTARSRADEPSNYEKIPEAMLSARACTWLLDRYAPGVKLGIASAMSGRGVSLAEEDDGSGSAPAPLGEVGPGAPHVEYRADGSTLPEHLRQPAAPDDTVADLIGRLELLETEAPAQVAALRDAIAPAKIPNLRHAAEQEADRRDFKLAHAMLLDRLFADIEAELGRSDTADPPPTSVYDDQPEAQGYAPDDDDGRPFQ